MALSGILWQPNEVVLMGCNGSQLHFSKQQRVHSWRGLSGKLGSWQSVVSASCMQASGHAQVRAACLVLFLTILRACAVLFKWMFLGLCALARGCGWACRSMTRHAYLISISVQLCKQLATLIALANPTIHLARMHAYAYCYITLMQTACSATAECVDSRTAHQVSR
jgi:hypothetical protein